MTKPLYAGLLLVMIMFVAPAGAAAQTGLSGYAVAGVGGFNAFFDMRAPVFFAGGGAELTGRSGFGAGGELGLFADHSGGLLGVASVNAVMRFQRRHQRSVVPFLTGGYTAAASPESGFNAWNVGAGILWPVRHRSAWRLEFRDHIRPDPRGTSHYWTIRAGVTFD